ncbi:AAA family ATPase [Shewanella sp. WXL01]|uniref:AAA family ATPase n=1 Tax=Shewanella sp. WXL01 TaxID=2709721 RepID=UPI0014384539|nr:AAA family ATPase [Shewanella sp. WXL01]NKF52028.1 AAA family ATPase [Shewanella sp. WXL01]
MIRISKAFFNRCDVVFGDEVLSEDMLCHEDMFMPLILAVTARLYGEQQLKSVVDFSLITDTNSLLFFRTDKLNIKDEQKLIDIIHAYDGASCLTPFLFLPRDISGLMLGLNVGEFAGYCREHFKSVPANTHIDVYKDLQFLFNFLDNDKLNELSDKLKSMFDDNAEQAKASVATKSSNPSHQTAQVKPSAEQPTAEDKVHVATAEYSNLDVSSFLPSDTPTKSTTTKKNRKSMAFTDLQSAYAELDNASKHIIQELAVMAAAKYFTENSDSTHEDMGSAKVVDDKALLGAFLASRPLLNALAERFGCQHYQIVFPPVVYEQRLQLEQVAETRSFGEPTTTWYQLAKRNAPKLRFPQIIKECLLSAISADGKLDVAEFVDSLCNSNIALFELLKQQNQVANRLINSAQTSQRMKKALADKVIGQSYAIEQLCQGYLSSCIETHSGPRAIYTFLGPSGVGKTYLATEFIDELNACEGSGYQYKMFKMEGYCDKRDPSKLFGSGIQYIDASLGTLTSFVRANPRSVLIFDEIEKAHPNVIQSLLSVLDSGIAKDNTSQEDVDFSQCFILFTSNLGQDLLASKPQNKQLSVFDVLSSSVANGSNTRLSPEFINRLAKGNAVMFSPLKVNHLLALAERSLRSSQEQKGLSYHWPENFASFMLKTMAPDLSVRRLNGRLSQLQSQLLTQGAGLLDANRSELEITVDVETKPLMEPCQPSILVLDDDPRVFSALNELPAEYNCHLCDEPTQLSALVSQVRPDVLLLDLQLVEKLGQPLDSYLVQHLADVPLMPIFTYQLLSGYETHKPTGADVLASSHDIREHFNLTPAQENWLTSMLTVVSDELHMERSLQQMQRRNLQLDYQLTMQSSASGLSVCYHELGYVQQVQSQDVRGDELFSHDVPTETLADVVGLERAKDRLTQVLQWLKSPHQLAAYNVKPPSGFLFAGPSGTGKTLLARALAGESQLPFFSVSSSSISASHSGGSADNIKKLFAAARRYAPSIVFIDEIDAIAGQRTSGESSADKDRNLTVNALLTEMDGFDQSAGQVFVMAATNLPELLDSALMRPGRFDETIYCDLPNSAARNAFFKRFADKYQLPLSDELLIDLVSASRGMSAAQIEQVFRETIYSAVSEGKEVTFANLQQTMIRVSYGTPSENISMSDEEKKRTAYHEAGHLLVSKLLFPNREVDFVTIEPRNQALGFVALRPSESYESLSKTTAMSHLEVMLAGRMAEKILTGNSDEVSAGASNDIEKATNLAMHVIYEAGLDEELGPLNIKLLTRYEESDLLLQAQQSVRNWLVTAEQSVERRLVSHKPLLDKIADALTTHESLLAEQINALFED